MSHARMSLARARTATAVVLGVAVAAGALGAGAEAASALAVKPLTLHLTQTGTDVVASVNAIRAQHGCRNLKPVRSLTNAAQGHANDMALTAVFSHTSADGRSWISRIRTAGWKRPGGENIAKGFDSVPDVMTAWMNSPDHRRNILNCNFRHIGVGYTPAGDYWVQDFGY
jgi:uncharacterized protein YkwD